MTTFPDQTPQEIPILDCHPSSVDIGEDVARTLAGDPPAISPVYLYDQRGSELFDRICSVEEYYPTRTELGILREHMGDIAEAAGPRRMVIEPGSGSGEKTDLLLDGLEQPVAYVPIDIAKGFLEEAAARHAEAHPRLEVLPVCADFLTDHPLPEPAREPDGRLVFFPGSTIGNMDEPLRAGLLRRFAGLAAGGGAALVGYDLRKDPAIIEAAYNDEAGVTEAFNLNLLVRLNREVDAGFDPDGFTFQATWNGDAGRVESDLTCTRTQEVSIGGERFRFEPGDKIRTEHAYKFTLDGFAAEAGRAGLRVDKTWQDERGWFAVSMLRRADGA